MLNMPLEFSLLEFLRYLKSELRSLERETGIEPAPSAWKAEVLPLNYSRAGKLLVAHETGGGRWIRTTEGVSQQIYSLPPLAAWVSLRIA
jgi:hypothetical protein